MNSHLNVFRTYTKKNRIFQLENDLTRAFAICMQEDNLFFHEILKSFFSNSDYFSKFFDDLESTNTIDINIQNDSSNINGFEKIYAASLSEYVMDDNHFWNQKSEDLYDPICDITISINEVLIIIEAKRDGSNCTSQLFNQVFNICQKNNLSVGEMKKITSPIDLNWPKLMEIAVKVYNFEKSTGAPNRFLFDFIGLVKGHNFRWLPEPAIISLSAENEPSIKRRIESVITEMDKSGKYKKLNYSDRLALEFKKPWAKEILYTISPEGNLNIAIYPGNTKAQGEGIFNKDPQFPELLTFNNSSFKLNKLYHIKFSGQGYFTGLWFSDADLKKELYTKVNFEKYAGRRKREAHWNAVEELFNECFNEAFDWKAECNWENKMIKSNRTQFDMSFGFELSIAIPFTRLKAIDTNKSDLSGLVTLLESTYEQFNNVILS